MIDECKFLTYKKNKLMNDNFKVLSEGRKNGMFHGCFSVNKDGTRTLIDKEDVCWYATNDPFWKILNDVNFKIKTRSQKKHQQKETAVNVMDYLCNITEEQKQKHRELVKNLRLNSFFCVECNPRFI